jgi:dihydroorotase
MALEYAKAFDVVIAEHCEEASLAEGGQMHEGYHSSVLGLLGVPSAAEDVIVARDLMLARLTGGRLHLCHLSTAGSVELVRRAKAEGLPVTAEVTPHHLSLTDEDLADYDTNRKVNPPIRSVEDRDALRAGLADGTIDAVATDHAPHAIEEKEQEFDHAPPGTIGLETALAVILTDLVEPGLLTLSRAVEAMSATPARILGAGDHGGPLEPGRPANLVAFDPSAEWMVEAPFESRSRNSAFLGRVLRGRVVHTMYRGDLVVRDGKAQR